MGNRICQWFAPKKRGGACSRFYAGAPIEVADGTRIGALCIIDKVAREFSGLERAMLRDLASLHAANRRRHDCFRTASHELRTPTASILGFSGLLLKREFDAATGR